MYLLVTGFGLVSTAMRRQTVDNYPTHQLGESDNVHSVGTEDDLWAEIGEAGDVAVAGFS